MQVFHKEAGGKKYWFIINSLKCTDGKCGRLHNELPDCMVLYKYYRTDIIEDVIKGVRIADELETEDYPYEGTMKHWKRWFSKNEANINAQMKSVLHPLLDLKTEFLKTGNSLLLGLRERISSGWLRVVTRFIYNGGGRIEPYPEA